MPLLRPHLRILVAAALLFAAAAPAHAWDELGHMVIVSIAWGELTPQVRERVTAILLEAPADAGLAQLRPDAEDPRRDELFAALASTWPDLVRRNDPAARHAYHRGPWHYINWYWREDAAGAPEPVLTLQPEPVNIVEALEREARVVGDSAASGADRAVALAWLLHLVGDLHQPLHTSARVTPDDPDGDKGGNAVRLGGAMTLHWYWDRVLSERYPRESGEEMAALVARVTSAVEAAAPRESLAPRIEDRDVEHWAKESLAVAEHEVYCCGLVRDAPAPESYLAHTDRVAEPAIALAGHRLAALLNRLLAP